MKVTFAPKFYLGEIRMIYFERLYKKALRVGADEYLCREADTLIAFARWESALVGREFDTAAGESVMASPNFPAELRDERFPLVERAFIAECFRNTNGAKLDWEIYFRDPDEVVESLQDELELME